jgi:hypothetical protein
MPREMPTIFIPFEVAASIILDHLFLCAPLHLLLSLFDIPLLALGGGEVSKTNSMVLLTEDILETSAGHDTVIWLIPSFSASIMCKRDFAPEKQNACLRSVSTPKIPAATCIS